MNLPFGFFCFLMIMCFAGGIYGIVENRKKTPGHPNIIPTICLLPMSVVALFYRYTNEFSTNEVSINGYTMVNTFCYMCFVNNFYLLLLLIDECKERQKVVPFSLPCALAEIEIMF